MPLVIRPATAADRTALDEQAMRLNIFEEPFAGDRRLDPAGGVEAFDHLHETVAKSAGAIRVAELDGAVVGHMVMWFDRFPPFVRAELRDYAYIGDLFVREAHRGRGIGAALVAEAEAIARARGVPRILLGVIAGNPAEHAYRKLGFRSYALEMIKDLAPAPAGLRAAHPGAAPVPAGPTLLHAECVEDWARLAVPIDAPGWSGGELARLELAPAASSLPTRPLIPGTEAFATDWLVGHHLHGTTSPLPGMACYFIRDATVSGHGQIWLGDQLVTAADLLPRYMRGLMGLDSMMNQRMLSARHLPERVIDAPTAVLLGHGIHVYGHFVIEMLFRFMMVDKAIGGQLGEVRYLLDRAAPEWLLRILTHDLRIPAGQLEFFDPGRERVLLRRAIVPTHVGGEEQGFHPLAAELADRAAARLALPAIRTPRRLFAARLDFRNPTAGGDRMCLNERTLIGIAQREQGFQPIALQTLPWPQQVAAYRNAEIAVGLFGSALHTALFSPPGSRMGVIGFGALVQSNIAALRQSELGYLSRDIDIHGPFTVDEDAFRAFLTALCAAPN